MIPRFAERSAFRTQSRRAPDETWLAPEPRQVAGTLLTVCAGIVLMGIITAEALYPGNYTTTHNTISDLGANPRHVFALRPSAIVFDATMIAARLLVLGSAYALHRAFGWWRLTRPMTLFVIGVIGVAFVPENVGAYTPDSPVRRSLAARYRRSRPITPDVRPSGSFR